MVNLFIKGVHFYKYSATGIAWYDIWFEISEEEYNSFGSESLDELALKLFSQGTNSGRFLFSDMNKENTKEQLQLREKAVFGAAQLHHKKG